MLSRCHHVVAAQRLVSSGEELGGRTVARGWLCRSRQTGVGVHSASIALFPSPMNIAGLPSVPARLDSEGKP
jgi:hypothetical protein